MCDCGYCNECRNAPHIAVMMMEEMRAQEQAMAAVNQVSFHTPVGSFEARFDRLHEHHFPEFHNGNQWGANLRQTDLDTGKSMVVGSFEVNLFPPP